MHNTSSGIDLTLCSSALILDYRWSVNEDLQGSDQWPIHVKYVTNLPSPCIPKWKIGEADWDLYDKVTKDECNVNGFSSPRAAYEYLVSLLFCRVMKAIPKTAGKHR